MESEAKAELPATAEELMAKMLKKRLYVIIWKSFGKPDLIRQNLQKYLQFMIGLEKRGALMAFLKENPPARLLRSPLADAKTYDGVKFIAQDTSWLMLRPSGTEPILRIYAEAKSDADVQELLAAGVRLTRQV